MALAMAKKSAQQKVRDRAQKLGAPFWEGLQNAGFDRFFIERVGRSLVRRFRQDRFARVKQGGVHGDNRADLARVFVDLDVSTGNAENDSHQKFERVVASWTRRKKSANTEDLQQPILLDLLRHGELPLEVILGGPGQGKSTIGRFLVLIHAAILVLSSPIDTIATATDTQQMEVLLSGLSAENIPWPDIVRWPVWIELRQFAGAMEEMPDDALLGLLRWYARTELHEADDAETITRVLEHVPWFMIFDGLDEVPPDESRAVVRAAVTHIRHRYAQANAFVIGTSRPQSYSPEAFGDHVIERTLLPLKNARALHYAERFSSCLHVDDENGRKSLVEQLRKAIMNPSTAALMTNPLLVTIMAMIIVHHGKAADRRWTLFEEYYNTLYNRETERGTYASSILSDHRDVIDAIHVHVGISLQARADQSRGVSAVMPEHELRGIIRAHLLDRFHEEEAAKLAAEILRASEQRLVFLVQAEEGQYSFELRSFQEFMAAWSIVRLREAPMVDLLHQLGPLEAWRNVVLFVMGYLYAKNSPAREDCSIKLCAALDERADISASHWLPGARLALAIVEDAPYGKSPKLREVFLAHALKLLQHPGALSESWTKRLWNVDPERVLAEIETMLGDPARHGAGWLWLFLLREEDDRVRVFAEKHWEQETNQAAIMRRYRQLWQSLDDFYEPNAWLLEKIVKTTRIDVAMECGTMVGTFASGQRISSCTMVGNHSGTDANWAIGSVRQVPGAYQNFSLVSPVPPLALFRAARALAKSAGPKALAAGLRDLAASWDQREQWIWPSLPPWPLHACFLAATSAEDLRQFAQRAEQGQLGDIEQWIAGERIFHRISLKRLHALAISEDPLRSMLVEHTVPPFEAIWSRNWVIGPTSLGHDDVPKLWTAYREARFPWVRRMFAQMLLTWMRPDERGLLHPLFTLDVLIELVEVAEMPWNLFWFELLAAHPTASAVADVIVRTKAKLILIGVYKNIELLRTLIAALVEALQSAPDSARLQRALVVTLNQGRRALIGQSISISVDGDTLDAWLLRYLAEEVNTTGPARLVELLAQVEDMDELQSYLNLLLVYPRVGKSVIGALIDHPLTQLPARVVAIRRLAILAYGSVGMSSPKIWQKYGFPQPSPVPAEPPKKEPMTAPFVSIEIENIRAFTKRFEVVAPAPKAEGQWLVFLGENATGKTTLLRSIAMALASPADAAAVPSNLDGPLRRDASCEGLVKIKTTDGHEFKTIVRSAEREEIVEVIGKAHRPWVVGYGCRRGSAMSGTDMDNAFTPFRDLDNLFDRPRGVLRASGWLKELQRLSKNNGPKSKLIYESAREALKSILLDAEAIHVDEDVVVAFKNGRRVPLALLSDGYLTTTGWVVDLMARWLDRNRESIDGKESFCQSMEGVVLLDEIDLHLHPKWQERIIEDVRRLFPKMSFIATTHNPLTLRGARNGEVFVLGCHDESGEMTAVQRDIPPGTRIDELITGQWFNRPSAIVDAETKQLLDEHQSLILAGAKAGSPKRKEIEAKLRERLGRFADTSMERLAATIAARYLEKDLPEPSAEKREEVRARVLEFLDQRDERRAKKKRS